MTNHISRRDFLIALSTLPSLKLAFPGVVSPLSWNATRQTQEGDGTKPNIMVVVFDALSAHNMSLYGYQRATTPNIDRLAESATVFHRHYAGANFTSSGTASLLMGLYPWYHRAIQFYNHSLHGFSDTPILSQVPQTNIFNLLPPEYHKVAYTHNALALALLHQFSDRIEDLKPRRELALMDELWSDSALLDDYPVSIFSERVISGLNNRPSTATFTQTLRYLGASMKANRLKRDYLADFPRGLPETDFEMLYLLEDAIDWVAELPAVKPNPYFAYVHVLPPHSPYRTRSEFIDIFDDGMEPTVKENNPYFTNNRDQSNLNDSRRAYDEFIAYIDAEFGRLYSSLEQSGALENTILVLTADHGEMFERGYKGHGSEFLYEPVVHVPLMIWKPGQSARVDVHDRTSAVDVVPTLLHFAGAQKSAIGEGQVLPTFGDSVAGTSDDRSIYSVEAKLNNSFAPLSVATLALYHGAYKLIHYLGYDEIPAEEGYFELFDLDNDPEELVNLYNDRPSIAADLREELRLKLLEVNSPFRRA